MLTSNIMQHAFYKINYIEMDIIIALAQQNRATLTVVVYKTDCIVTETSVTTCNHANLSIMIYSTDILISNCL